MLAGRESLTRLVGKRKRTLSSSVLNSLLLPDCSPTTPPPLLEGAADGDAAEPSPLAGATVASGSGVGSSSSRHGGVKDGDQTCGSEWVDCPVCGISIRGTDFAVNHHLDSCLARGTKRKLTQRTLVQLNFFSKSGNELCSNDLYNENKYVREREMDVKHKEENPNSIVSALGSDHTCGINEYVPESLLYLRGSQGTCNCVMVENMASIDPVNVKVDDMESISSLCCFPIINVNKLDNCSSGHTGTQKMLQTFIVGCKFHDNVDLWPGAIISLLRESTNANDSNAIKVLSTVSGCEKILGYLPRELAKYLSPLIDNYGWKFEGSVASLPKHPSDAIPINLVCEQMVSYSEIKPGNIQGFESLWENAVHIAEYSKNCPSNKMRYQQNFHIMLQEVMNQHAHLLTDEEKSFLESFGSFSDDSQRIFIRLYMRKGPWFRISNVCYPEVLDSQKAIRELQLAGYVCSFQTMQPCKIDVRGVSDTLTIAELREISNLICLKKVPKCTKKQDLIYSLCAAYEDGTCSLLPGIVSEKAGICVKISSIAELLLWRVQRLFFLNGEQDLSAFLLVDLGLVKYPSYVCNVSQPIFHGRNSFLAYEEAIEIAQILDQSLDENDVKVVNKCVNISDIRISASFEEISQSSSFGCRATFLSCFSASWVYSKVITLGVSFLEHEHRYEEAVKLLRGLLQRFLHDGRRGYWTLRLSVDLEHIGFVSESLSVAEEGILDPWVRAGSKVALQRRVLRLGKPPRRWKIPNFAASIKRKIKEVYVKGRPLNCETGVKNRYYGYNDGQCSVEQLALQYYSMEGGGWQGAHTETGIWMTIFGLLMWDVLFADILDVFRTRFQTAPFDLDSDSFYESRRNLIESQLQMLQDGMAEEVLIISWESHVGTACRGVNWDNHSLSDLRAIVSCIGGHCLASICRLLAQDYRSWSSGMPDLLLWRFHGDGNTGEAKLVEVKGPRDRLSEQQQAWMLFLMDSGFNAEVCRVSTML